MKQHVSDIWSSIHEKFKQHWGWVEKDVAYKKACIGNETNKLTTNKKYTIRAIMLIILLSSQLVLSCQSTILNSSPKSNEKGYIVVGCLFSAVASSRSVII